MIEHLYETKRPKKFVVLTGVLDYLDNDLVGFGLSFCGPVSLGASASREVSRCSVSMASLSDWSGLELGENGKLIPWDLPWDPFYRMARRDASLGREGPASQYAPVVPGCV